MLLKNKKIAIVGGGPAGLTLARLLQLKGVDVNVYERDFDRNARIQGSPLDLHDDSGLAALRKAALLDEFKNYFRPGADRLCIADQNGKVRYADHEDQPAEEFGNAHFRPEIDRGPLRDMLLASLKPDTVVWDSHFLSMETQNEGWLLHFKNGAVAYADFVVAADGANSKIRPYLTDIKPVYSGVLMLEGFVSDAKNNVPNVAKLMDGGKIMAFGDEKCVLVGSKAGGALGYYASFKASEDWPTTSGIDFSDRKQVADWFKKAYAAWGDVWQSLFEKAEMPFFPRRIYYMPLDQAWTPRPNLTLIGDAAHVMPPFAGEGANMAMLDALKLSECLTEGDFENLQQAVAFYETEMRKTAHKAINESIENGTLMHSPDALDKMVAFFSQS